MFCFGPLVCWHSSRCKIFSFFSSRSLKMRENILVLLSWFCLVCVFFEGSVFVFQFLNDKIHNYVKKNIIVHFILQKLKSKHTSLKKYTNWAKTNWAKLWHTFFSRLERTRGEKIQIFCSLVHSWVESAKEKPGSWTYEGKTLSSIDDIKTAGQMRILTVHEVGQGLIKALEYDNVITKSFHFLLKNLFKVQPFLRKPKKKCAIVLMVLTFTRS